MTDRYRADLRENIGRAMFGDYYPNLLDGEVLALDRAEAGALVGLVEHDREVAEKERERCAQIAESRHSVPVGANTLGEVTYQETARYPDDGRRIAAAIRQESADVRSEEER